MYLYRYKCFQFIIVNLNPLNNLKIGIWLSAHENALWLPIFCEISFHVESFIIKFLYCIWELSYKIWYFLTNSIKISSSWGENTTADILTRMIGRVALLLSRYCRWSRRQVYMSRAAVTCWTPAVNRKRK